MDKILLIAGGCCSLFIVICCIMSLFFSKQLGNTFNSMNPLTQFKDLWGIGDDGILGELGL